MKNQIVDHLVADQMLRNDAVHVLRRHVVIPSAIGLHADQRPAPAHSNAADLAELHARGSGMQACYLKFITQCINQRLCIAMLVTAYASADHYMAFINTNAGFFRDCCRLW